jgi:hypothetical protein
MKNVITFQQYTRLVEIHTTDNRTFQLNFCWTTETVYSYQIYEIKDKRHLKHQGTTAEFAATVDAEKLLLQYLISEGK